MMDSSSDNEERIEQAIAEYLAATESGAAFDQDDWLVRYEDVADELREFVETHQHALGIAASSHNVSPEAATSSVWDSGVLPTHIGNYEIIEEIGRGGMGIVFRARHRDLQRIVALKVIRTGEFASAEETARFRAETEACARLQHPNIVPIYDVGEQTGLQYFTMALIDGPTLVERIQQEALQPKDAARLVQKLALAIDNAHAAGIVHRDLKPANILFNSSGEPFITDFGLAKMAGTDEMLTTTGQILGTPAYMAPEQATGRRNQIGESADVYSLGCILYFALTRQAPFHGPTPFDVLLQVLERDPTLPRQINRLVPAVLERICLRAMAKQVQERYSSAKFFAEDLGKFLKDEPVAWPEISLPQRLNAWWRREPILVSHLCGIGATAFIVSVAVLMRGSDVNFYLARMLIFTIWALASITLQWLLKRPKWKDPICLTWAATDIVLYTSLLLFADPPRGPLLVGYPMLICASALFYRRTFVVFMTSGCALGFLALVLLSGKPDFIKPDFIAIFLSGLVVIGLILSTMIRRIRALCAYYDETVEQA
jgi:eukaryotic-like serine/threonine-protein kinase